MSLLELVLALVLVGVVMYLLNTYVPMDPGVKKLMNIVVILILVLWVIQGLGLLGALGHIGVRPLG